MKYRYSHTALERWACPFLAKSLFDAPEENSMDSPMFAVGSAFHELAEAYTKHLVRNNLPTDMTAAQAILDEYMGRQAASIELYEELKPIFQRWVNSFVLDLGSLVDSESMVAIDHQFAECPWNSEDVFFRARMDRVHVDGDICTIIDYKTDRHVPSATEADSDSRFKRQAEEYAWISSKLLAQHEISLFKVDFDFVRYNATRSFEIIADVIPEIEKSIMDKVAVIESYERFRAIPCSQCSFCPILAREECPVQKRALKESRDIGSHNTACAIARELVILERLIKDKKESLKKWVNDHGDVKFGDLSWSWQEKKPTISFPDSEKVYSFLIEAGLNPGEIMSLTDAQARKCLNEDVYKSLVQIAGRETRGSEFKLIG